MANFHDNEMYAINRVGTERHGQDAWLVHLSRGGKSIAMTFSDSTYGGKAQALEVARAYRDAVLRVVPPLTNKDLRMLVRKNRPEGGSIPGVYHVPASKDRKHGAWIARIEVSVNDVEQDPSDTRRRRKALTRTFSIKKHGYEGARRLAEEERIRMVLAVENGEDPALRSPAALALHQSLKTFDQ